jgi:hypothetical protein
MTDISITAANVLPGAGASLETGTAGEALTAGQAVYKKAADKKWYKADCNSATAEVRVASAIVCTGSAAGQPVVVQKGGPITIGGTVANGIVYYLSGTPGGIRPVGRQHHGRLSAGHRHGRFLHRGRAELRAQRPERALVHALGSFQRGLHLHAR